MNVYVKSALLGCIVFLPFIFLVGFHNLDTGWNIRWLNAAYMDDIGVVLGDTDMGGVDRTGEEGITVGYRYMLMAFVLMTAIALVGVLDDNHHRWRRR